MSTIQDTRRKKRSNLFTNDLKSLLYAFGDVQNPHKESITVLEDILQEYIVNLCHEAHRVARTAGRQKIKVDDFKFALRNDPRKLGRVEELLTMQREINDARKTFDNSEGKSLSKNYVEKGEDKGATANGSAKDRPAPKKAGRPKKYKKREKKDKPKE